MLPILVLFLPGMAWGFSDPNIILPGGHQTVSFCHIARCICRRAERAVSKLHADQPTQPEILVYLNRLSDFLFVLARKLSKDLKAEEIKWIPNKTP